MSLKENTTSEPATGFTLKALRSILLVAAAGALISCSPAERLTDRQDADRSPQLWLVPGQLMADNEVYSIRLHRTGRPGSAPVIELNRNEQLRLSFETIGFESRSFRIHFTHRNPDWSESGIPPERFSDGFFQRNLTGGTLSRSSRPYFRTYEIDFPDREISFRISGNYMVHVTDADTREELFSMPFFVHENQGSLRSSVEISRVPRQDLRIEHRPVNIFQLPDMAEQPQFNLEFRIYQNQMWGRPAEPRELDFSDPSEAYSRITSGQAFIGDYEFRQLNLENVTQLRSGIADVDPAAEPVILTLTDDAEGFTRPVSPAAPGRYAPSADPQARYAEVRFRFHTEQAIGENEELHLVGDFNRWSISDDTRMEFNETIGRWEAGAVMKEGSYRYKYVVVSNGRVDDLRFDALFAGGYQQYHTFVYYRDLHNYYYRLLQFNSYRKEAR